MSSPFLYSRLISNTVCFMLTLPPYFGRFLPLLLILFTDKSICSRAYANSLQSLNKFSVHVQDRVFVIIFTGCLNNIRPQNCPYGSQLLNCEDWFLHLKVALKHYWFWGIVTEPCSDQWLKNSYRLFDV